LVPGIDPLTLNNTQYDEIQNQQSN